MHIVFLSNEYPPLRSGGIGTNVRNVARALVRCGHQVSVLGLAGEAISLEDRGVRARFLQRTAAPRLGWINDRLRLGRELRRMVREEQVRIVEAPDWGGLSAGIRPGCPVVIRCNGSATYFAEMLGTRVRRLDHVLERSALRQADAVVAVSRFTAARTAALFGLSDVGVVPNGIDVDQFEPGSPAELDGTTVLYFGSLIRKKGPIDLCRAFNHVAQRHPGAVLRLMGRDLPDRETGAASTWELCRSVLAPDVQDRVEYIGRRSYDEVQDQVRRASVCVFPSYAEAMPLAWLEAMACGCPVVAYDIGWAREAVVEGETGFLVPPGDTEALSVAIDRLLVSPSLREQMGRAARRHVAATFSAQRVAEQTLAWYDVVLAHAQPLHG